MNRYPARIGFDSFDGRAVLFPGQAVGLGAGEITVASLLRRAGYATKLVGKWHCGDQPEFLPTRHGFDSYFGLPYSNDMGRRRRRDGSLTPFPPLPLLRDERVVQEQPDQAALTERYVDVG
jgi:arylsulfatase A-like enzyme